MDACKEGKGVLLFGAHFGNWEIGNAALAIMTHPFVFIYRIFDSPLLEKAITGVALLMATFHFLKKMPCGR